MRHGGALSRELANRGQRALLVHAGSQSHARTAGVGPAFAAAARPQPPPVPHAFARRELAEVRLQKITHLCVPSTHTQIVKGINFFAKECRYVFGSGGRSSCSEGFGIRHGRASTRPPANQAYLPLSRPISHLPLARDTHPHLSLGFLFLLLQRKKQAVLVSFPLSPSRRYSRVGVRCKGVSRQDEQSSIRRNPAPASLIGLHVQPSPASLLPPFVVPPLFRRLNPELLTPRLRLNPELEP